MEERELNTEELKDILKKREKTEKYKKSSEDAAASLKALKDALIDVGFTDDQAFQIIIETISKGR